MADDLPINDVDALDRNIKGIEKMIEKIESGTRFPKGITAESLKRDLADLKKRRKRLGN